MARTYKKKRNFKKKRRAPLYKKPRTFSPGIYSFKRSTTEVVDLIGTEAGWIANTTTDQKGIGRQWAFKLSDLNDNSDFYNLFKYYRIKAVRVQMYFSNSITVGEEANRFPNSQIMVYTDINHNGETTGIANLNNYLDSQTSKRVIALGTDRKPIDMLMKVKQSNMVYKSTTDTDYTLQKPQWISTGERDTPHYGMNMFIGRVDGDDLSSGINNNQKVRFVYTYYIQCKKVI